MYVNFEAMKLVWESQDYLHSKGIGPLDHAVLLVLARRAKEQVMTSFPQIATIASETLMSKRSVSRSLETLSCAGVIKVGKRPGKYLNFYTVLLSAEHTKPGTQDWDDVEDIACEALPDMPVRQYDIACEALPDMPVRQYHIACEAKEVLKGLPEGEVLKVTTELNYSPADWTVDQERDEGVRGNGDTKTKTKTPPPALPGWMRAKATKTNHTILSSPSEMSRITSTTPTSTTPKQSLPFPDSPAGHLANIYYQGVGSHPSLLPTAANKWPTLFSQLLHHTSGSYTEANLTAALQWGFADKQYWSTALDRYTGDSVEWFTIYDNVDKLLRDHARSLKQSNHSQSSTNPQPSAPTMSEAHRRLLTTACL